MSKQGPSPLIPFLLVMGTLGFLLRDRSDVEDSGFTLLVFVPVVALLSLHQITQGLIVPLSIALTLYTITKMLIGPLLLMLIMYFVITLYVSSSGFSQRSNSDGYGYREDDHGLGCVLLLAVFLGLYVMFSQGFEQWGVVLVALLFFLFCNFR